MSINLINELNYENLSIRLEVTFCVWCFIRLYNYLIKIPVHEGSLGQLFNELQWYLSLQIREHFQSSSISLNNARDSTTVSEIIVKCQMVWQISTWEIEIFSGMTAMFSKYTTIILAEVFGLMSIKQVFISDFSSYVIIWWFWIKLGRRGSIGWHISFDFISATIYNLFFRGCYE